MIPKIATRIGSYANGKTDVDPNNKGLADERTIFVAIASYRDWQCRYTVENTGPFENEEARGVVDEWAHCHQDDAVVWAKEACSKEGMMIRPSSGAALKVAIDVASLPESKGKTIVVVFASHGIRYTAHPLWKEVKAEASSALPVPPSLDKEAPTVLWASDDAK